MASPAFKVPLGGQKKRVARCEMAPIVLKSICLVLVRTGKYSSLRGKYALDL